jgi:hypothetical protein
VVERAEAWLKWQCAVDTLCRGEVAEWLNAAVSKTVTSAIPASGVRIPPSPLLEATGLGLRVSGRQVIAGTCSVRPDASETRMMLDMVRLYCPGILV